MMGHSCAGALLLGFAAAVARLSFLRPRSDQESRMRYGTTELRRNKVAITRGIERAMQKGLFTPSLGAGASSLRSRRGNALSPASEWLPVASQLRRLLASLEPETKSFV